MGGERQIIRRKTRGREGRGERELKEGAGKRERERERETPDLWIMSE